MTYMMKSGFGSRLDKGLGKALGKVSRFGLVLLLTAAAPSLAHAECRDVTISAKGAANRDIDAAQLLASEALVGKIAARFGQGWGTGSRRNGAFDCHQNPGGYRPVWTCQATTSVICKAST